MSQYYDVFKKDPRLFRHHRADANHPVHNNATEPVTKQQQQQQSFGLFLAMMMFLLLIRMWYIPQ